MKRLSILFQQPLFHFLLIGVAIFVLFDAINDEPAPRSTKQVVVTAEMAKQLAAKFQSVRRRPPTSRELTGLIDNFIKEEVLVREAVALSLEKNDAVIRNRLRQKMEFLIASAAAASEPSDDELRAYFDAHATRYASSAKIAFEQIFLGEAPTTAQVAKVREALKTNIAQAALGARTLLPSAMPLSPQSAVNAMFGTGFFKKVSGLQLREWGGPIRSGFGLHLLRINEHLKAEVPAFKTLRKAVLRDWKRIKAEELAKQQYARILDRYSVGRPDLSSLKLSAQ